MKLAQRPYRVDIWHNILWSKYKGEVFSAIDQIVDTRQLKIRFIQIAETEGTRVALSGVDLAHHRYPLTLLFKGSLDDIPLLRRVWTLFLLTIRSNADLTLLAGYERIDYWVQLLALKIRGKKVAVFCDSTIKDQPQKFLRGVMKRIFFKTVDAIFCYGTRSMEYVAHYGASRDKIFKRCQAAAVPHDYSKERVCADRLKMRVSPRSPRYLYVGRLSPEKDLTTLMAAFALVKKEFPRACLVLVGEGPQREILISYAESLGISESVSFSGSKTGPKLFEEYSKATCLVLPSLSEPWGLVVNEALSYACPAIVSRNCGCVPELVIEGRTGLSYDAGNIAELAAKMIAAPGQFADMEMTNDVCLGQIAAYSPRSAAEQIISGLTKTLRAGPLR